MLLSFMYISKEFIIKVYSWRPNPCYKYVNIQRMQGIILFFVSRFGLNQTHLGQEVEKKL